MSNNKSLVQELLDRYCLLTPDAHELLEDVDATKIDIDKLAELLKDELVVNAEKLKQALVSFENILSEGIDEPPEKEPKNIERKIPIEKSIKSDEKIKVSQKTQYKNLDRAPQDFKPLGKRIKANIKILQESTGQTTVEGKLTDFRKYFLSRYKQMKSILRSRGDIGGSMQISDLERAKIQSNEEISIIGIITDKISLKKGGMLIEIEDPSGRMTLNISSKKEELVGKAGTLLLDQVVGFTGTLYENMFLVKDFVLPDIPLISNKRPLKSPINVCMTSDLHIGSKEFLEDSFMKLIDFLNGKVDDPYQRSIASQVKYLIINGDLVEGIGIYPKQEDDLIIADIYDQYKYAAKLLMKIPDWINIIIVSGNHDACRLALPQPAIGKEYAPDLWNMPNVTMLSNPSVVSLHTRKFLIFHGNSFEDVAALTPGLNMSEPNGPMLYTLRYRHLAPTFGRRTSIVPSAKDELVIETVPDVYHTGHIHINSHTQYRGVECINSGTFQSQTDYMLSKNIHPTPGRVPILNLQTKKLHELVFYEKGDEK